jgi:hypothetical protein
VFKGVNIFQARTNLLIKWVWILRLFYCIDGWRGCKIGKLCFLPVTIRPMPQLLGKTARVLSTMWEDDADEAVSLGSADQFFL